MDSQPDSRPSLSDDDFTPLSQWLGRPEDAQQTAPSQDTDRSSGTPAAGEKCRARMQVERNGDTISRIHLTCSCGETHTLELHELPSTGEETDKSADPAS